MERKEYDYALFDSSYLLDTSSAKCYTVENTIKLARKAKRTTFFDAVIVKQEVKRVDKNQYEIVKSTIIP
jgi:uncharacterized protein YchJ